MGTFGIFVVTHVLAMGFGCLAGRAGRRAEVLRLRRRAIGAEVRAEQLDRDLFFERTRPERVGWDTPRGRAGLDRLVAEIRSDAILDLRDRP